MYVFYLASNITNRQSRVPVVIVTLGRPSYVAKFIANQLSTRDQIASFQTT